MVILKSEEQLFDGNDYKDWNWLFFNNKEADCILYSEDGHGFRIHKEILSQTEKMCNILFSFKDNCCGIMEIFCPCPKDELEQLVKFLYSGIISYNVDLIKTLDNLITIFGFSEKLILKDENNKEFKLDELITKDIGITEMNCQTSSLQTNTNIRKTSNFENNAIMEDIAIELNANDDSIINGSNENVNGANPDNSKTISITNVFERPRTTLNLETSSKTKIKESNIVNVNDPIVIPFKTNKSLERIRLSTRFEESQIKQILPIHKKGKPYDFGDSSKEFLTSIDEKKKPILKGKTSFSCKICDTSFKVKKSLKRHIALVHEGKKPFQCNTCKFSFLSKQDLEVHTELVHAPCGICGKVFQFKQNLKRHIETVHEGKKPFKCNLCEFSSASSYGLDCHEKSIHLLEKPFKCDTCEACFGLESNLKRHIISAHGEKRPFQCYLCDANFKLKQRLKRHTDTVHEGKKPFKSYKCNV